ncbi:MAG: H-type lectin domain-containing protein [Planctomycetes bacterium]|nr:H-type lectin domain-containing protein [Planctomycetota bacterium]
MAEIKSGTFSLILENLLPRGPGAPPLAIVLPVDNRPERVEINPVEVERFLCGYGDRILRCTIRFANPFARQPCAEVVPAGMDASCEANCRLRLRVVQELRDMLVFEICTWAETRIHSLRISYIAHVTD